LTCLAHFRRTSYPDTLAQNANVSRQDKGKT
jgi:hypothetical protein